MATPAVCPSGESQAVALSGFAAGAFVAPAQPESAVPLPQGLLAAVPPPVAPTLEELQAAMDARRLLVVRLAIGIPVTTVIAVLGAVAIHAFLAGGLWLSAHWSHRSLALGIHDTYDQEAHEGGSGGGGSLIDGEFSLSGSQTASGNGSPAAPVALPALPTPSTEPPAPRLPQTPALPAPSSVAGEAVAMLREDESPMIGLSRPTASLETPRPLRAPPALARPSAAVKPGTFASPTQVASSIRPGTGGSHGTGTVDRGGVSDGTGGDDDEPVIELMKPGVGKGSGRGRGNGNDIDRGPSAANLEHPALLDWGPDVRPPANLLASVTHSRVCFNVTVLANGKVGDIELSESSGNSELDAIYRAAISRIKFRPAYHAGKPIAGVVPVGWDLAP